MSRKITWMLIALTVLLTVGCQRQEKIVTNRIETTEQETEATQEAASSEVQQETENSTENSTESSTEETVETEALEKVEEVYFDTFDAKITDDNFKNALTYIKKQGTKIPSIDYSTLQYLPEKRNLKAEAESAAEEIDAKLSSYSVKKIRMMRTDNNGTTIDFTVYTDNTGKRIDKIVSVEYCSDGRDVTNFYFRNGSLNYAYAYKDDIYGSTYRDSNIPGKKCYFSGNALIECYINDDDVFGSNSAYTAKDYDSYDKFIRTEYDALEKDMLNRAYMTYTAVKDVPGTALINGYVADEYGGILSNVKMKLTSKANEYTQEFTTNGDGYYEVRVPVNKADWYGIHLTYGDFKEVTIDDINIPEGTIDYSLGITYMAAEGENKHDTEYYLLDVTQKSPKRLRNNEYQIVMTFDSTKANLQPFTMSLNKGKSETSLSTVITVDEDSQYKYFVTDQRGGRSENTMTYEMSVSEAVVKVYNKDGLVASYQVPVNRAGVVWEVFEIDGTEIVPVNNYYFDVGKEIFFQ